MKAYTTDFACRYFSATNLTSSVTRSTYWFGVPLKGYADVDTKKAEQEAVRSPLLQ